MLLGFAKHYLVLLKMHRFSCAKVSQDLLSSFILKINFQNYVLSSAGTQEAVARARDETGDALNIVVIKAENNYDVSRIVGMKITKVRFIQPACFGAGSYIEMALSYHQPHEHELVDG